MEVTKSWEFNTSLFGETSPSRIVKKTLDEDIGISYIVGAGLQLFSILAAIWWHSHRKSHAGISTRMKISIFSNCCFWLQNETLYGTFWYPLKKPQKHKQENLQPPVLKTTASGGRYTVCTSNKLLTIQIFQYTQIFLKRNFNKHISFITIFWDFHHVKLAHTPPAE